ncbi:unannotated protein [freshwater metagenome]|uniref:Unannotated protein n=1 Tax=freshwater metagenome TaxID=449393 RepID=A0A6J6YHX0_9ZZZZ
MITKDGILNLVTKNPLMKPHESPIKNPARTPTIIGAPPAITFVKAHMDKAIMDGKERSISPVMTTKVSGIAISAKIGVEDAKAKYISG